MDRLFRSVALAALAMATLSVGVASAAVKYWDINNATPGAGGATPSGNWTSASNWTTDPAGGLVGTTFASGTDTAVFSAGTDATGLFTVTTIAPTVSSSITVEEGTVRHAGTSTNTLTTSSLTINSGATFGVNVALSFTPAASSTLTLNGGTIENYNPGSGGSFLTSGSANTNMKITLGTGGGHVSANGGAGIVSIYTGLVGGTGPLTVDGTGTWRLTTTPATYSGSTIINGRLQISTTADVIPDASDMVINSGGVFDIQKGDTIASVSGAGNIIGTGGFTLTLAGSTSPGALSGTVTGSVAITKTGSGTMQYAGASANTYTNTTTINGGTLELNKTAGVNAIAGPLTMGASGTTKLLASNQIADTVLVTANGTFNMNNLDETVGAIAGSGSITNVGNLTMAGSTSNNFTGTIAGNGNLIRSGAGTTGLTAVNSYAGSTTINTGGTVTVDGDGTLGNGAGALKLAGGTFSTTANRTVSTDPIPNAIELSASSAISTTATAATVNLNLTTNSITASAGSLLFRNDATAGTGLFNPRFTANGFSTSVPIILGAGLNDANRTTQLDSFNTSGTQTFAGIISGAGAFGRRASSAGTGGTTEFTAPNTYSGGTFVNDGTLLVNNTTGSGTGGGAVTVLANGTLSGTGTVGGNLTLNGGTVAGTVAITGTATSTGGAFTGTNTVGATSLTAGTTKFNGTTTTPSVAVSGAAVMGGGGSLSSVGAITFTGGNLAPGNSAGTLSLPGGGALVLSSTTALNFELNGGDNTTGSGVNDLVAQTGDLTLAGTVNVADADPMTGTWATPLAPGTSWTIITYTGMLTDMGLVVGTLPAGMDPTLHFDVDTSNPGQVNLVVAVPEAGALLFGGLVCGLTATYAGIRRYRRCV